MNLNSIFFEELEMNSQREQQPEQQLIEEQKDTIKQQQGWDPISQQNLNRLFDEFFIDNLSEEVRSSTLQLLIALWQTGIGNQREEFMRLMENKSRLLLHYGKNGKEFFKLFSFICCQISKDQQKQVYQTQLISLFSALINSFNDGLKQLLAHEDNLLYQFLEDIVDDYNAFKPLFLEVNGCLNCYGQSAQNQAKEDKLGSVAQEIRSGNCKLLIKLKKTIEIYSIIMPRDAGYQKSKRNIVKTINVYVNNNMSADMNSLKSDMTQWKKIKSSNVEKDINKEYTISFSVPVAAKFICLEFAITAKLPPQCSRCSEVRAEGSGFYCSQCQYSPIIQVENTALKYKQSSSFDNVTIDSDKAKENCEASIAEYTLKVHDSRKELIKEKQKMRILYDRYHGTKCNNSTGILLNSDDLDRLYQDLMTNMNYLMSYRKALAMYNGIKVENLKQYSSSSNPLESTQHNCYGCLQSFLGIFLSHLSQRENLQYFKDLAAPQLVEELIKILEDIYSNPKNTIPEKLTKKAMKIHKNMFVMFLGESQQLYLNNMINSIQSSLLAISFQEENQVQKSYQEYRIRLVDIRILQETVKEQIEYHNSSSESNSANESETAIKKLLDINNKIIQLINVSMQHYFLKKQKLPLPFQNEVLVSLLEILISEIQHLQLPSQKSLLTDQIFSQKGELNSSGLLDRKSQYSKYQRYSQSKEKDLNHPLSQNPFGQYLLSSQQQQYPGSRENFSREQFFNQVLSNGSSNFGEIQSIPSWASNIYAEQIINQEKQNQALGLIQQQAAQKKEKKQPKPNQIPQQPESIFPSYIPFHSSNLSQPQPSLFPQSQAAPAWRQSRKEIGDLLSKKGISGFKGSSATDGSKLQDLFCMLIGQTDDISSSSSSMEIEQTNKQFGTLKEQSQFPLFKLNPGNWLQKCVELFDSQRLQELVQQVIITLASLSSRIACTLLLHALPSALINQGSSMNYFELFREVILLLNSTNSNKQMLGSAKKLPGLSMIHQQSSEDVGFARKDMEEEEAFEEKEYLFILSEMFKNLDIQLKNYAQLQNKQLLSTQDFSIQNLQSGTSLNSLIGLIKAMIENTTIKQAFKANNKLFMQQIISAVVSIRKFKFILNQNFYSIESILSQLFQELQSNSIYEKQTFLTQLFTALPSTSKDPIGQEFLMEQVNKILIPKKLVPNLRLEVQSNQREYLPSSLPKKDIPASDFGVTMNDILLRIKSELPDASWVIEMLVANKLINNKDLPIDLVYKKVWIPSQLKGAQLSQVDWKKQVVNNPMKIIYRITGFDGEAHEELVDQIADEDQNTCLQLSKVLFESNEGQGSETCGIASLFEIIKNIYQDQEQKSKLLSIITILNIACKHSEGRHKSLHFGGLNIFLRVLMKHLPNMNENEPESLVQNIFELIQGLLDEAEQEKLSLNLGKNVEEEEEECFKNVNFCIEKIEKITEKGNVKGKSAILVSDLSRILPILTYDYVKPSQFLVNSFSNVIEFQEEQIKKENLEKIQKYIEIAEKIPEDFQSFREESVKQGILQKAIQAFISVVPSYNQIDQVKAKTQKNSLKRCLQVFIGLSKGNYRIQQILNEQGILHSIYQLADPSIKIEEIGKLSELLIEYIVNEKNNVDKVVSANIIRIKQEEMNRKKEKADQVKKNQLSMLNTNAMKILKNFNFSDIEEEQSIKCVVCQEGYTLRPKEIMGAYIFSTIINIPDEKKLLQEGNYSEKPGATSATSFNCIHLKCHQDAVQADANSKKPKSEWEGALIRNSEAKCNNWFPLKGQEIDQNQMEDGIKKYLKGLGAQGKSGHTLVWILINDFKGLLLKFAKQEDIAKETRTTFEHNLKIFPFFISTSSFVLKQNQNNESLAKVQLEKIQQALTKMLAKEIQEASKKLEFLTTFLVLSLFVVTWEEWQSSIRKQFLKLILNLFVTSYFKANTDLDARIGKYSQSTLVLFTLVNSIFNKIHSNALKSKPENLSIFHEKIEEYVSCNYDMLIEQFQIFHSDYRDKITKFTKVSEFLEYCGAKEDIFQAGEDISSVLSAFRE